jgi:2-succinyl-5-enolpyruvyl-6-hydroxy-3-cyclohexene-1-carboxylate synthase
VISADRPQSKIDIGDGQTIRQENVYSPTIHCSMPILHEDATASNDLKINEAVNTAIAQKRSRAYQRAI